MAWKHGQLSWKLRPEQAEFKKAIEKTNHHLVVGLISRRWGKSFSLVTYAIEQALKSKQKIRYGCAFLSELEEFILPAFEQILEDCPARMKPIYKSSRKVWKFKNGSEIKLVGLDKNPNGLRGNAIRIIIIDEAGFVKNLKNIYTTVIIPATMKMKGIRIIFITTPPESPDHFLASELINKAKLKGYFLKLTIDDISDLEPDERTRMLDEVGGEDSVTARREFFCEIVADEERAVCPTFKEKEHVKAIETTYSPWYFVADTGGVKDLTVGYMVNWSHELQKVVFRSEAYFKAHTPTTEVLKGFKALEQARFAANETIRTVRYIDAGGQLQIDYATAGFAAALPPKDDFQAGLTLLRNEFYKGNVIVHPDCPLLIQSLSNGLLNRQRSDYERSESLGHCDAVAAAIYALRVVDRKTNLKPAPHKETVWVNPHSTKEAKQKNTINKLFR